MRRFFLIRALIAVGLALPLAGPVTALPAVAADELRTRIEAIPGVRFVAETTRNVPEGFRHLTYFFQQPIDHRDPGRGSFQQRFTVLHRGFDRPVVAETDGYMLTAFPYRAEPTRLVDGNQVVFEHRFFDQSRPDPLDWSKLDIWQSATDHHRIITALRGVYPRPWITTGASKNGMTAVYHRRFYPGDVDGTVPYVAPNDVDDAEDSALDRFFATVGSDACRQRVTGYQRRALTLREEVTAALRAEEGAGQYSYQSMGGLDRVYETWVLFIPWSLWQGGGEAQCLRRPDADSSVAELVAHARGTVRFLSDQGLTSPTPASDYRPYYYQAATQLGHLTLPRAPLRDLLRYPQAPPSAFAPGTGPMVFQPGVMRDIDSWVRDHGSRFLFVYGQNDPWSVERFPVPARESASYLVPGANHGANIGGLPAEQASQATALLRSWAGVGAERWAGVPRPIPGLDDPRPPRSPVPLP